MKAMKHVSEFLNIAVSWYSICAHAFTLILYVSGLLWTDGH